jgi:GAF domain-containing protein/sugar diacid utilization regulator
MTLDAGARSDTDGLSVGAGGGSQRAVLRAFGVIAAAVEDDCSMDDLLRLAARELAALVRVPRCLVYTRLPDRDDLFKGRVAHNADEDLVQHLTCGVYADRLTREMLETKASVVVEDVRTDDRIIPSSMRAWQVSSVLGVPMVQRGEVEVLFWLDDPGRRHVFTALDRERAQSLVELAAGAVTQTRRFAVLREENLRGSRQIARLRRAMAVDHTLWRLTLEDVGITALLQQVSDLLGRSCALYDDDLRRISALAPSADADQELPLELDRPDVRTSSAVRAALERPSDSASVVVDLPPRGHHPSTRLMLIRGREAPSGCTLVVGASHRRFTESDALVCRRAAPILNAYLESQRNGTPEDGDTHERLGFELLSLKSNSSEAQLRAEAFGLPRVAPRGIILFAHPEQAPSCDEARRALERTGVAVALTARLPTGAATVVDLAGESRSLRELATGAMQELGAGELTVVISDVVPSLGRLAAMYAEMEDTLACIAALGGLTAEPHVVATSDIGPARSLLAGATTEQLDRFVAAVVGPLLQGRGDQLLPTAEALCQENWNARAAAARLDVHENTVRYRTKCMESLGLPVLTDARVQMEVQLALLVRRFRSGDPLEAR